MEVEVGNGGAGLESFGDPSPKVRKPYTITKQRQKWTEVEHQKFLEALKLYGRGWRKIEEHVGTKTAIQIRSHAQKFFSKVARESNNGTGCSPSVNSVEIPPPRPKRKPIHPYPRKPINAMREGTMSCHVDSAVAKETPSPRSVLPTVGSESGISGVAGSDDHNGCPSPSSCSTYEKETGSPHKLIMSSSSSPHNPPCFKLFGRTVLVTDITPKSLPPSDKKGNSDLSDEKVDETRASDHWSAQFQPPCVVEVASGCPLQWSSCQALPFVLFMSFNPTLLPIETVKERSCSSSDAESIVGAESNSSADTNFSPGDSSKKATNKGFVPYKRCLVERNGKSPGELQTSTPRVES